MGPGGGQPAKSPSRSARFYVSLARGFMDTCLHEKGKAKAVENVSGGRTTWPAGHVARPASHHLTKSVTSPWTPVNTALPVEIRTHTTIWRSFTVRQGFLALVCLSVSARVPWVKQEFQPVRITLLPCLRFG
jgi:hypothetical protein